MFKGLVFSLLLLPFQGFANEGTYPYCSNDACRTAYDGKLSLFFGVLPMDVRTHCRTPGSYAMTFDDGPSDNYPAVLSILAKKAVPATFFVMGSKLQEPANQALLRSAHEQGHQISNHTYSHPDLLKQTDEQVVAEIQWRLAPR